MSVRHHDLCFGCGTTNLFGVQMEVERQPDGSVAGRFFVKQDHQGPPGKAHGGVIAAALDEAMSLAIHGEGIYALTAALEVSFKGPAAIGTFVRVSARITERAGGMISARAEADVEEGELRRVAEAAATFVERARPESNLAGA